MEPLVVFCLGLIVYCGRIAFVDYFRDMADCLPKRKVKVPKPAPAPVTKLYFQSGVKEVPGLHVGQRL